MGVHVLVHAHAFIDQRLAVRFEQLADPRGLPLDEASGQTACPGQELLLGLAGGRVGVRSAV